MTDAPISGVTNRRNGLSRPPITMISVCTISAMANATIVRTTMRFALGRTAGLPSVPLIVALGRCANVIDLAGMVEVVLDHRRDQPARLTRRAQVGHARLRQLIVVQSRHALAEDRVAFSQPVDRLGFRGHIHNARAKIVPAHRALAEGLVGVYA